MMGAMTWLAAAGAVLVAAFVKGAIGLGFPTVATPLLTLFVDVKTAVVVLILPNIVMDSFQFARRGAPMAVVRRMAVLIFAGGVGTVLGTALLVVLSSRTVMLVLGVFVLLFVALSLLRVAPTVGPGWEPWLSPAVGLLAGVAGGVTNVYGTTLILYFYALGMAKHEFVASLALTFLVTKIVQLGSVAWYGLLTWPLVGVSLVLTAIGLAAFRLGTRVQDRLEQRAFNRAVLAFLGVLGVWLVARALSAPA
jgi:hypothetical protein